MTAEVGLAALWLAAALAALQVAMAALGLTRQRPEAIAAVRAVLHAARCARARQPGLAAFVAKLAQP